MSPLTPITVHAPRHRAAELAWVCEVLFDRWLGLPARIEAHDLHEVVVQAGNGRVVWADVFLAQSDAHWLQPVTLPMLPLPMWPLPDAELLRRIGECSVPQCFGDGRFERQDACIRLPIDITGSIFFMLSRYEESVVGAARDRFGRTPGATSVAHRAGLALRPLVDEWLELLWWAIQQVAPNLLRRRRTPSTWVSCDVDMPYSPGTKSVALALRQTASHLVKDHSLRLAGQALLTAAASRLGVHHFDAYDAFDWMLDLNERAGHRMTFFFLSVHKPKIIDGCYELAEPRIAALLGRIVERGHEVGLHGSFHSIDEPARLACELTELRNAVAQAGGRQPVVGGRQHYLRWNGAETARLLDKLGLAYDSTMGFPDIAGFRCGTCHAYPLFDLAERRALAVLERPLVLMEVTVIASIYLNLGHSEDAWHLMMGMRDRCKRFGGEFSLLWHNSNLRNPGVRALYEALIQP